MLIPFEADEVEEVRVTTTKALNVRYMSNGKYATPLYLHAVLAAVHALMTSENAAEVGTQAAESSSKSARNRDMNFFTRRTPFYVLSQQYTRSIS